MEELNLLKKLNRVKAPPGFDQKLMAELSLRQRRLEQRRRVLRLSLAGALASFLVLFFVVSTMILKKGPWLESASSKLAPGRATSSLIEAGEGAEFRSEVPIIETLDYSTEIRNRAAEVEAVYLLEEVKDRTFREIKY